MKRHTYQNPFEEVTVNNSSLYISTPNTPLHSNFLAYTPTPSQPHASKQAGKSLNLLIRSLHIFVQKLLCGILL